MLEPRQYNPTLRLILSLFIFITDLAILVGLKKNYLTKPFISIDLRRQRCSVTNFQSHKSFPLWFKRRDVYDNSTPRIGGFAQANRQHISRNPEIFNRTRQRKRIRRNDAHIALVIHQRPRIKILGIHNRGIHIRKNTKLVRNPDVVPIRRHPVADDSFPHLPVRKRLNHFVLQRHAPDPAIWLNGHSLPPGKVNDKNLPSSFKKLTARRKGKSVNFSRRK